MVIASFTVTFSDLVLQILAGAIVAGLVGRILQGGGFGIIGDLLFGAIGAIVANFVVGHWALFNIGQYGLPGELIIAAIGAIVLVVIGHLFTGRRSAGASA
ncbi:MAG: GlsB/YeaQ/YmgE family stress response membrane protein [Ktedonobacterales bacterium]